MDNRIEELRKAKEEMAAKVRALPVGERVQAARLYEIFVKVVAEEEAKDKADDVLYNAYDGKMFAFTDRMDELAEGRRAAEAEDFDFWKEHIDPAFVAPAEPDTPAAIPSYWRKFIENSSLRMGEFDAPILDSLSNISIFREEAKEGETEVSVHRLVFQFGKNDFFTNNELSFRLYRTPEDELLRSEGCKINWTKNPTVQKTVSKKKNKRTGEVRNFTNEVQKTSFFELFANYEKPDEQENEEEEGLTLLGVAEFVDALDDYLPYALEYYLDLHPEDEEKDEGSEGSEEEDETGSSPPPVADSQPAANPECKQQ